MDNVIISIILPAYNAKNYIAQCITSLTQQTYQNTEILIIDDGSTDGTGDLCDEMAAADPRIRVIHKENGGVHTARNLGISQAKGDYLMFIDSDDWIDPDTVERVATVIREKKPDVVRFTYVREYGDRSSKKTNSFLKVGLSEGEACRKVFRQTMGLLDQEWAHPENFNFLASSWAGAFKKSLIIQNHVQFEPRDPVGSFEDGLFNLKAMRHAKSFYYIDAAFYHYRKTNADACTANYRKDYLKKQTFLFSQLFQMVSEEADPVLEKAFYNRVVFSNLELCLNVVKSTKTRKDQLAEIKEIINSPIHSKAREYINLGDYPIKWKVYFFFIKHRMTMLVYFMTKIIRYLQKRG